MNFTERFPGCDYAKPVFTNRERVASEHRCLARFPRGIPTARSIGKLRAQSRTRITAMESSTTRTDKSNVRERRARVLIIRRSFYLS